MVTVTLEWGATLARLSVQDEGPGISEEGQARIFEVFHREEDDRHLPGLGLGLFITKQIVESHGGTISVRVRARPGCDLRGAAADRCRRTARRPWLTGPG